MTRLVLPASMLLAGGAALGEAGDVFSTLDMVPPSPAGGMLPWREDGVCNAAGAGEPLALPDVVERALCNNPQTREAWTNARYQAELAGAAHAPYLPTVSASGGVSLNNNASAGNSHSYRQGNAGISLGYILYDFGARDANLESAEQVLAAANASQDAVIQAVFLAAVDAYYRLFATQAAVDAARETEKSNQESFNAANARYKAGVATPADKLQAQTAYSQAVLNRVRAEGDFNNARGVLANVMGYDAGMPVELAAPSSAVPPLGFEDDVARLIEQARRYRPDLNAAEAQIRAAQAGVESASAAGKPTVSLTTALNFADASDAPFSRSAAVGVQVSIPIFTGYENTYRIRAAREQVELRQAQREKLSLQIALDVWKAYQGLATETQAVRSSQDLLASAVQSEKVAMGRYQAGVGNILDLLAAQSALASARQQQIQALYNWHIAKAGLAQSMGQLDMAAIGAAAARTDTDSGGQP